MSLSQGILLEVAYDGTDYHGFQYQERHGTIQRTLERAVSIIEKKFTRVKGASRTDAGVHAIGQRVFYISQVNVPETGYRNGLNARLPDSVSVIDVKKVSDDFNPRRTAGKLYRYTIRNSPIPDAISARFQYTYFKKLDIELMKKAAVYMVGEHDFSAFQAADCVHENSVRKILRISLIKKENDIIIDVAGTAFLKNMVRILAGTLLDVGRGRISPEMVESIIAGKDRTKAGPTLPAKGLSLIKIIYPGEDPGILTREPNEQESPAVIHRW